MGTIRCMNNDQTYMRWMLRPIARCKEGCHRQPVTAP